MSTAAMHAANQYSQAGVSSAPYTISPNNARYLHDDYPNNERYYTNQSVNASSGGQQPRQQRHLDSETGQDQEYYQRASSHNAQASRTQGLSSLALAQPTSLPYHTREHIETADQYDGAPIPPARSSSQQQGSPYAVAPPSTAPLEARVAATRQARQAAEQRGPQEQLGDYDSGRRDGTRDDPAASSRSRRRNPTSPDGSQYAARSKQRENEHGSSAPPRSEPATSSRAPPAPLNREYSEVLDRVVVSDPSEDAERLQERVAEAQPVPLGSEAPVAGNTVSAGTGTNDAPGPARRQDYSKSSSSRRKEIQFGEYVLGQTLGEGEFGKVKLGWKRDGSSQVAIKLIRRDTVASNPSRLPKIYREISILRDLAHPNIVRLHEIVETERHIGIILEYASGGELFDYILNHRYLKDPAARRLFAQLISGVGYLHKKGIVHRDLKLENLLLDANKNIIITDFGFANTFNPVDELSDEIEYNLTNKDFVKKYKLDRVDANGMRRGDLMQTSCGSPCYAAPELVVSDSLYTGRKVDVWSCGVILYAMLAGFLPFDDDPANPEGDNINLLYKYITSTPLTFPEYVTPHARDLLRRILVPNPRKRADLFEVARHSWLNEYHHVVSHITSSTTNVAEIANSTVTTGKSSSSQSRTTELIREESAYEPPVMNRSASVREERKPSGAFENDRLAHTSQKTAAENGEGVPVVRREKSNRHTLQPEYVAPHTHTARVVAPASNNATTSTPAFEDHPQRGAPTQATNLSKSLPQNPPRSSGVNDYSTTVQPPQAMPPPTRPARNVPRSASDSTGAIAMPPSTSQPPFAPQHISQTTRPSTQGSLTSAGPTRSDLRLPSRGSYGQPVAPTVATTNVQGRVTQPSKSGRGYNISGPIAQHAAHQSIGQPTSQQSPLLASPPAEEQKANHHRRSSTLSNLGERLFGRSNSVAKKDRRDSGRQSNGRKYPPVSMKETYPADAQPRMSTDSKRSFSFGLGKKRSSDLEGQDEKPGRRFSLLKGLMGGRREEVDEAVVSSPDLQAQQSMSNTSYQQPALHQSLSSNDGQQDADKSSKYNNFSRPPQAQYRQPQAQSSSTTNDVYGGTGVYSNPQQQYYNSQNGQVPQYPEGFSDSRPSLSQDRHGRNVLSKPNRKFNDGYNEQGSSGAVKRVQDFFRRRGRARMDQ